MLKIFSIFDLIDIIILTSITGSVFVKIIWLLRFNHDITKIVLIV